MAKLSEIKTGSVARICSVAGDERFLSRVTAIGLTEGCTVEVLQNVCRRPMLLYARDSTIALDRDDCGRIEAEVIQ